jgi:xylulokinase
MLLDTRQGVLAVAAKEYSVEIPRPGYAEQDPQVWWDSLKEVLAHLKKTAPKAFQEIAAVGYSGQMHGLVLTDEQGLPVRPAILWLDQRSKEELQQIQEQMTAEEMGKIFCNRVSTGFAFPSLLWVDKEEPDTLKKAKYLLCPKDYIRMKMTGKAGVDVVDASSTCLFDTVRREWAWEIIDRFHLPRRIFPPVAESMELAGTITKECAAETGLPQGIPVIYGTGDQPAQSIGNGVVREGALICNIGTGGQISAYSPDPIYDRQLRANTFCHAILKGYTIYGATLCSGMSLKWVKNQMFFLDGYDKVNQEAASVPAGCEGLIYLPYLSGERTPHMDPEASGMFFGIRLLHERRHFLRAVMEGVAYSLRECLELLNNLGIDAEEIIASGGGAASPVWLQIQADILGKPVRACTVKEQACLGACILAGAGTGLLPSIEEGVKRFVTMSDLVYEPKQENFAVYEQRYKTFQQLYRQTKDLMR